VTRLAAYLDDNDVPIDYQRRRRLDYSDLLPPRQWPDLCRRTGTSPGQGRRDKIVRCMLFACISGLPVESAPDFAAAFFQAAGARILRTAVQAAHECNVRAPCRYPAPPQGCRPRLRTDSPKTRPGRPDQRILALPDIPKTCQGSAAGAKVSA
jgi:hypothetical protein